MHLKTDLLLLHGALGAAKQFDRFQQELSSCYNTYTFEFSGHGLRSHVNAPLSIQEFTKELSDFIGEKGLEGCDVFGYSMGGYVALNAASNDPSLFGRIVTLATKFSWDPEIAKKETSMLNSARIREKVPAYAEFLQNIHGNEWESLLERTSALMNDLGSSPVLTDEALEKITNKVLVAVGDRDKMVSIDESREAASKIRNAGFAVIPYTAHPLEQVDPKVISFLFDLMK